MGYALPQTLVMDDQECISCGTPFAMARTLLNQRRKDKALFYCPNGHGQSFTESEADRLRAKLDEATRANTSLAQQVREAQEAEQRAVNETKRLKRRIHAGVCPCCKRTFQNLARHMATKHKQSAQEAKG